MSHVDNLRAYYDLADALFTNRVSETHLARAVQELSIPYLQLLSEIADQVDEISLNNPRWGWSLACVASASAETHHCEPFLISLALWYLGRASNQWGQPKRVASAITAANLGFQKLREPGWIAACTWQKYALSWTQPDYKKTATQLSEAVDQLEQNGFRDFIPHCRLSLAFAQVLIGDYKNADANTLLSEEYFSSKNDELNKARSWLNYAGSMRRQGKFDDAMKRLGDAALVFTDLNASIDNAKVHYQVALCHLMRADDLQRAESEFQTAAKIFQSREMDLWEAACISNLGYLYLLRGELNKSDAFFARSRSCFTRHEVLGLLSDNLNDHGKLNILRGLPQFSIQQFNQAMKIHENLGAAKSVAIDLANLGECYGQLGRYQDALHYLESAAEKFESLNDQFRLGAAEKFTARIWSQLNDPKTALKHLEKAEVCHIQANQQALLPSIYNLRANILFNMGENAKALDCLRNALAIAQEHNVRPQAALAKRLLGEVLIRVGNYQKALLPLQQSNNDFSEIGMSIEQAFTQIDLGVYYLDIGQYAEAKEAFELALSVSGGIFYEVDWRAYAGLATLAEKGNDLDQMLLFYRQGVQALDKICNTFWQPALIGSYLQDPSIFIDQAINKASLANSSEDALFFIETHKSTALNHQLIIQSTFEKSDLPQMAIDLRAEIEWLQNQIRVTFDKNNPIKTTFQNKDNRLQLIEKIKSLDLVLSQHERRVTPKEPRSILFQDFNVMQIQNLASQRFGKSWIAVDYHKNGSWLNTVVITSETCQVFHSQITERMEMAISAINRKSQAVTDLEKNDLRILGELLIPDCVASSLDKESLLIISPHKILHRLPWSAIQLSGSTLPLVHFCIPAIVPSLRSLIALDRRSTSSTISGREVGLLFAVSEFNSDISDLPQVKAEITNLSKLAPKCLSLLEENATWINLGMTLSENKEFSAQGKTTPFAWLHIASHHIPDTKTGRMSQIALQNGSINLDQLRDLSGLPPLVTFSACSGMYSLIYEGDSHVSLQTTCLISGANSVVGTLWPVLDDAASLFASLFYENYIKGFSPSHSLAISQRKMIEQEMPIADWAGFECIGMP